MRHLAHIIRCWSNYLGRPPQLYLSNISVPKFDVFPNEDADIWSPWTDTGLDRSSAQPSRTRAVALLISALCEISEDIQFTFYRLGLRDKGMRKETEIKRLSELHDRLETWQKKIPLELEPREGQLPHVLTMQYVFSQSKIHFVLTHIVCFSTFSTSISSDRCSNTPIILEGYRLTFSLGKRVRKQQQRFPSCYACTNVLMVCDRSATSWCTWYIQPPPYIYSTYQTRTLVEISCIVSAGSKRSRKVGYALVARC